MSLSIQKAHHTSPALNPGLNAGQLEHDFPFDPTYGHKLGDLLAITPPPAPADFNSFWQTHYAETLRFRPTMNLREIPSPRPDRQLHRIQLTTTGNLTLQGWLDVPRHEPIERLMIQLHGYCGRSEPEPTPPARCAVLQPGLRGLPPSLLPHIPASSKEHVLQGIENRDTYVLRGCVADIWCATTALLDRYPQAKDHLHYLGGSFGGGIGALALAFDPRFTKACLGIPTFGQHPMRLTQPCTGSGEAVRLYAHKHPEVSQVLAYYDSSTAATRIRIPTMVSPALFDPSVPPPGQFAVYNALITAPGFLYIRKAGHFCHPDLPGDEADEKNARQQFFDAPSTSPLTGFRLAPSLQASAQ